MKFQQKEVSRQIKEKMILFFNPTCCFSTETLLHGRQWQHRLVQRYIHEIRIQQMEG